MNEPIYWDPHKERYVTGKCYGEGSFNNRPRDCVEEDEE